MTTYEDMLDMQAHGQIREYLLKLDGYDPEWQDWIDCMGESYLDELGVLG